MKITNVVTTGDEPVVYTVVTANIHDGDISECVGGISVDKSTGVLSVKYVRIDDVGDNTYIEVIMNSRITPVINHDLGQITFPSDSVLNKVLSGSVGNSWIHGFYSNSFRLYSNVNRSIVKVVENKGEGKTYYAQQKVGNEIHSYEIPESLIGELETAKEKFVIRDAMRMGHDVFEEIILDKDGNLSEKTFYVINTSKTTGKIFTTSTFINVYASKTVGQNDLKPEALRKEFMSNAKMTNGYNDYIVKKRRNKEIILVSIDMAVNYGWDFVTSKISNSIPHPLGKAAVDVVSSHVKTGIIKLIDMFRD